MNISFKGVHMRGLQQIRELETKEKVIKFLKKLEKVKVLSIIFNFLN
jgi:type III secretory pathway component EscU